MIRINPFCNKLKYVWSNMWRKSNENINPFMATINIIFPFTNSFFGVPQGDYWKAETFSLHKVLKVMI